MPGFDTEMIGIYLVTRTKVIRWAISQNTAEGAEKKSFRNGIKIKLDLTRICTLGPCQDFTVMNDEGLNTVSQRVAAVA